MLFLVLAIIFSTVFSLGYKVANRRGCNLVAVNGAQNFGSLLLLGAILGSRGSFHAPPAVVFIALLAGLSGFVAILSFFYVIRNAELSISWTVVNLSLVIPFLASIFIWGETPHFHQLLGIAAVFVSFFLFAASRPSRPAPEPGEPRARAPGRWWLLPVSFFFSGITAVCSKWLVELRLTGEKLPYLFYYSMWVCLFSLVLMRTKGSRPGRKEWMIGTTMGIAGMTGIFFFLSSLESVPGIVGFPVRATGTLIATSIISAGLWKERIGVKGIAGIALAIIAIFLIST